MTTEWPAHLHRSMGMQSWLIVAVGQDMPSAKCQDMPSAPRDTQQSHIGLQIECFVSLHHTSKPSHPILWPKRRTKWCLSRVRNLCMGKKAIHSFSTVLLPLFMLCSENDDILTFKFYHRIGFPPLFLSYRFPGPSNRSQSSSAWLPHFFRNLRVIETSWQTGKSFKVLRWHRACLAILFPVTSPRYAESRSLWASWCHEQTPATETMRKTLPTSKLVYLVYML